MTKDNMSLKIDGKQFNGQNTSKKFLKHKVFTNVIFQNFKKWQNVYLEQSEILQVESNPDMSITRTN